MKQLLQIFPQSKKQTHSTVIPLSSPILNVIWVWIGLRLFTSIWAFLISIQYPKSYFSQLVPVWPPFQPLNIWLERLLVAPWYHWDVGWYTNIVTQNYHPTNGTSQFHPLYPLSGRLLYLLGAQPTVSLLFIAMLSSLLLAVLFYRLASLDVSTETAQTSTLLFLLFPTSFILFAPYSEALFLLFSVLCFLLVRSGKWFFAGITGALAVLTRQQGIFLVIPLAWELWVASEKNINVLIYSWRKWLSIGLIPFGYLLWIGYRILFLRDAPIDLSSPHALIYSLFISPSAYQVVDHQTFILPWNSLWLAFQKVFAEPDVDLIVNLFMAAWFLLYVFLSWKSMRMSYRLYTIAILLISFSYHTGAIHPYMGLPRHLLLAFPVFITLGEKVKRPSMKWIAATWGISGQLILLFLYVFEGWVP